MLFRSGRAFALGGARQAPMGHGIVGLQLQTPAEGALGFVKPEGVQQRVALVEPLLDLGVLVVMGNGATPMPSMIQGFWRGPESNAEPCAEWPLSGLSSVLEVWA